jgi:hypothetical protein
LRVSVTAEELQETVQKDDIMDLIVHLWPPGDRRQ